MAQLIRNFCYGLALGVTETVPGVSGGTVAIILGCYFELIDTINHFRRDIKKSLRLVLPLVLGVAVALVAFGSLIHYLLMSHSLPTMLFFIGLIVGIIPIVFDRVRVPNREKPAQWLLAAVPFALLIAFSSLKNTPFVRPEEAVAGIDAPYMLFLFAAGALAAAALIVPGFSGSFLLLLIGVYPLVTYAIHNIPLWLADPGDLALLKDIGKVLAPLGLGIIVGGLSMAKLIENLLATRHAQVYSAILGLLLGSVYALFRDPIVYQSGTTPLAAGLGAATFCAGCALSYTLGKKKL